MDQEFDQRVTFPTDQLVESVAEPLRVELLQHRRGQIRLPCPLLPPGFSPFLKRTQRRVARRKPRRPLAPPATPASKLPRCRHAPRRANLHRAAPRSVRSRSACQEKHSPARILSSASRLCLVVGSHLS